MRLTDSFPYSFENTTLITPNYRRQDTGVFINFKLVIEERQTDCVSFFIVNGLDFLICCFLNQSYRPKLALAKDENIFSFIDFSVCI
jgi:hypothetical protein